MKTLRSIQTSTLMPAECARFPISMNYRADRKFISFHDHGDSRRKMANFPKRWLFFELASVLLSLVGQFVLFSA